MSGDGGGKALSTLIQACVSLEDLRFSATRCGNSGCMEIAKVLYLIVSYYPHSISSILF